MLLLKPVKKTVLMKIFYRKFLFLLNKAFRKLPSLVPFNKGEKKKSFKFQFRDCDLGTWKNTNKPKNTSQ